MRTLGLHYGRIVAVGQLTPRYGRGELDDVAPAKGQGIGLEDLPRPVRKNRYSVEARAVGRPSEIRAYAEHVQFWHDGHVVGRRPRAFGRDNAVSHLRSLREKRRAAPLPLRVHDT